MSYRCSEIRRVLRPHLVLALVLVVLLTVGGMWLSGRGVTAGPLFTSPLQSPLAQPLLTAATPQPTATFAVFVPVVGEGTGPAGGKGPGGFSPSPSLVILFAVLTVLVLGGGAWWRRRRK